VETPQTILLAEDNPDDILLVRMAFKQAGFVDPLEVVRNGAEAIQYLKGQGHYTNRQLFPVPAVVLLDLKMPIMSGFEVLTWLRQRAEWKCLPVVVLTTSFYGPDIEKAYDLGANSFLTKSVDLDEFVGTVRQLCKFWLHDTRLPTPGPFVPAPAQSPPMDSPEPVLQEPRHFERASTAGRAPQGQKSEVESQNQAAESS
jgi:CheY-like chemotaxis protein